MNKYCCCVILSACQLVPSLNSLTFAMVMPYLLPIFSNFCPITNVPFISKILERVALTQLQSYLAVNSLHETFQSGFKALHCIKSALLRVSSDIITETDSGKSMALVFLDLSAAFDLRCLEISVGFRGVVYSGSVLI